MSRVASQPGVARGAPAAALARADDEQRRHEHLQRQQLSMLCRQATRSPFAVIVAVLFVAFVVWPFVPGWKVLGWAGALMTFPVARGIFSWWTLRHPPSDARPGLRFHLASLVTGGVVVGMAAPLFFGALPDERRAFLTMIIICWAAAGVSPMAAYARSYYAYVLPIVLQVAAAWALVGTSSFDPGVRFIAGALIVFAGVILAFFARDTERVLRESFAIRYENERLIDKAEAANRAKSRFLAAASHDLRQPLHALRLFSGALTARAPGGDIGEIGRNIRLAAQSLSALVDSLLDISKLDAGAIIPQMERVDVRSLVERIAADFRPIARDRQLELRVRAAEAEVESDPVLLESIVRNLVDNAMKYTERGSVTVAIESEGSDVRVAVRDTGPGIAPKERKRIFEEFYQIGNPERDRSRGLGLGLAIVRRLAALLGYELELESEPGKGSEFAVRMPKARLAPQARPRDAGATAPVIPEALAGTRILVIDDEPSVRDGMRELLESWGCQVAAAGGHAEAEQLLADHGHGFDLIVADFRLRQRENGIETVHRVRARLGREVPALLLTGDTAPERLREARDSGLPLLHKPISEEKLQEALLDALRS